MSATERRAGLGSVMRFYESHPVTGGRLIACRIA
jgi:hypothetical protein